MCTPNRNFSDVGSGSQNPRLPGGRIGVIAEARGEAELDPGIEIVRDVAFIDDERDATDTTCRGIGEGAGQVVEAPYLVDLSDPRASRSGT